MCIRLSLCNVLTYLKNNFFCIKILKDFPGGTVDRNALANAGNIGSVPGPGRFHIPWGN